MNACLQSACWHQTGGASGLRPGQSSWKVSSSAQWISTFISSLSPFAFPPPRIGHHASSPFTIAWGAETSLQLRPQWQALLSAKVPWIRRHLWYPLISCDNTLAFWVKLTSTGILEYLKMLGGRKISSWRKTGSNLAVVFYLLTWVALIGRVWVTGRAVRWRVEMEPTSGRVPSLHKFLVLKLFIFKLKVSKYSYKKSSIALTF